MTRTVPRGAAPPRTPSRDLGKGCGPSGRSEAEAEVSLSLGRQNLDHTQQLVHCYYNHNSRPGHFFSGTTHVQIEFILIQVTRTTKDTET
jgi:hypothetical protein